MRNARRLLIASFVAASFFSFPVGAQSPEQLATAAVTPPAPSAEAQALRDAVQARLADAGPRDGEDRKAMAAFYAARNFAPLWTDAGGMTLRGRAVHDELARADEWGLKAADLAIPDAAQAPTKPAATEVALSLAVLKYARHARGGRIDPIQLSNYLDRKPAPYAPDSVLEGIAAADAPDTYLHLLHPRHPQFEKLRQAWLSLLTSKADAATARRVLLNLEQWRWMPDDLGAFHVIVNVPEFTIRVVKGGTVVHTERVIAGLVDKQTPIFSASMETIYFHPTWGIPDSIKVKEILPSLLRGKSVLTRHNLRIARGGKDVDPSSVDWTTTDIRSYSVYQPPGGNNVLGLVKFAFPNQHQVYMHDTPDKKLFAATSRTFSHGCMRIREPLKLAEVLLAEDKGWNAQKIAQMVAPGAGQNNGVALTRKIPVHIVYFTTFVDDEGKLQTRPDVYGHEDRIQMGLDGKAHLIVKRKDELGAVRAEVIAKLSESTRMANRPADWKSTAFGLDR